MFSRLDLLIPQSPNLASPAHQAGELHHIRVFPAQLDGGDAAIGVRAAGDGVESSSEYSTTSQRMKRYWFRFAAIGWQLLSFLL
jgi:hypothetical protein